MQRKSKFAPIIAFSGVALIAGGITLLALGFVGFYSVVLLILGVVCVALFIFIKKATATLNKLGVLQEDSALSADNLHNFLIWKKLVGSLFTMHDVLNANNTQTLQLIEVANNPKNPCWHLHMRCESGIDSLFLHTQCNPTHIVDFVDGQYYKGFSEEGLVQYIKTNSELVE